MNDLTPVAIASVLFFLVAIGLMVSHVRAWREHQREEKNPTDLEYRRRQYRRRMLTSATLGAVALAMFVGTLMTLWLESRLFFAIFWGMILLAICWITVLAVIDLVATKRHFNRVRYDCLVERAKLQAELGRMQNAKANETKEANAANENADASQKPNILFPRNSDGFENLN
jgi:amino acid permease